MSTSLQFPASGNDAQRVTAPDAEQACEELKRALLPVNRQHPSAYTRNLTRRIQQDRATPQVHVYDMMAAKQDAGEPEDVVLQFPVKLMSIFRLRKAPPRYAEDYATICDSETEMQSLLDRVQIQLAFCVTPSLIRNALDAIARYRAHLDSLEAFLRARLETMALKVAR